MADNRGIQTILEYDVHRLTTVLLHMRFLRNTTTNGCDDIAAIPPLVHLCIIFAIFPPNDQRYYSYSCQTYWCTSLSNSMLEYVVSH